MLQVEPQAAESNLQQDDVAALWSDGGLLAPSKDFNQQGVQLQRVPPQVFLQQGPLPELPGCCPEQEEVEADGQETPEAAEPHLLAGDATHKEEFEPTAFDARSITPEWQKQLRPKLGRVPAACLNLHVGTRRDGRHSSRSLLN